ncbi:hypothetical protein Plhal304r1_c007g0030301 [Plasmopara halstedii]
MEERRRISVANAGDELSWAEVQGICSQLEGILHDDALKDAARLRGLAQKRKDIASTFQERQSSAQRQLAHLRANLSEWKEKEQMAKQRNEELYKKLRELDAIKRDMAVQLDRFRLNEQYPLSVFTLHFCLLIFEISKESLDMLLDKYEEARQEFMQYNTEHQNDIPAAKNQMSLYASITGIRWDFNGSQRIVGDIHVPAKLKIVRFEVDPAMDLFIAANTLWDKIDEAFDYPDNNERD